MSTNVKEQVLAILKDNDSLPSKLKSHMIDTVERSTLKPSSITMNGRVLQIALNGTDAIHLDNLSKLIFFHGMARIEVRVKKALYKSFVSYYTTSIKKPSTKAA